MYKSLVVSIIISVSYAITHCFNDHLTLEDLCDYKY